MTNQSGESSNNGKLLWKALGLAGACVLAVEGSRLIYDLVGPTLPYRMRDLPGVPLDSEHFVRYLSAITDAAAHRHTRIRVLKNATEFYPSELQAIRSATKTVSLECYAFLPGQVAQEFVAALTERARAGVAVKLVVDSMGSISCPTNYFDGLRAAGGEMKWYRPLNFRSWPHANNRTHRKLLVVDGSVGFTGGAGIADHWATGTRKSPPWRDSMFRMEGAAVGGLVAVFAENWLETAGEILAGSDDFPFYDVPGDSPVLVVGSSPQGGTTRARILFQTLLDCARESIRITSPYFLPDRSARHALERAVKERGVKVKILTAGSHSDHVSLMKLSESMDIPVMKSGAEVYKYRPAMIHAKLMTVDGLWTVFGSTNFDHRSFALNDEVNVAVLDRDLAHEVERQFEEDLQQSGLISLKDLRKQPLSARAMNDLTWLARRED